MGIFNIIRGQFIDVIEWKDPSQNIMVYRYDCDGKPTSTLPRSADSRAAFDAMVGKLL